MPLLGAGGSASYERRLFTPPAVNRCRFSELAGLPPCLARAAARVEGYLEGSTLRLFLHRQAPPCATGTLGLFAAYLPGVRPRTFCAIVVLGDLLWIPASAAVAEVLSARGLGD